MPQFKPTLANYGLLSLPATAMGFALCVQIAALSWILNTQYKLNLEEIGLVWLAGPTAGILGQVLIGVLSDNVWFWGGRRRPFIVIGGTLAALMILALPNLGLIQTALGVESLIGIALTVALTLDLAINVSFNPARSIIADVTPKGSVRTNGFTYMQTVSGFFGVLAYLIGAFISNYVLIYTGAVIVFLFSVIPAFLIKEPQHLEEVDEEVAPQEIHDGLVQDVLDGGEAAGAKTVGVEQSGTDWGQFLKICLAHAFTWVGVQTMFIYTFGYIKQEIMGHDVATELSTALNNEIGFNIGIAFALLNTVGFLLPALVLSPVADKIGRVKTQAICIAISALGYTAIIFFGTSIWAFFGLMLVVGIGWAAVVSLPFAIMSEVVDSRRMGFFMGLFNLSVVLPQIVASLLGGVVEAAADKSVVFLIAAVTLGVSSVLWLLVREPGSVTELTSVSNAH